jgi:hypothetical protein
MSPVCSTAARASEKQFSSLGQPWRSHPRIEGYPEYQWGRAVDMERSGRRQEPIADAQSGLIVYVTVLLLPAGHTRGALVVVLVKYVSVCDSSS